MPKTRKYINYNVTADGTLPVSAQERGSVMTPKLAYIYANISKQGLVMTYPHYAGDDSSEFGHIIYSEMLSSAA